MNSELSKLANLVTETVKPVFGGADVQKVQQKPDGSLVSAIDLLLQRRLIDSLRTAWPSVPVLGEEMSVEEQLRIADTGDFFVVDPLDGTTNFINGIPFYAVSLALVLEGRTRMAVTFDPSRDECFAAESGGGAWLGNERLRVASATPKPLAETVAVVDGKRLPEALSCAIHRLHPFRSMRNFGSVALEWAWLAAGRIDVYLHGGQKLWDRLPGQLILQEAGGSWRGAISTGAETAEERNALVSAGRAGALDAALLNELLSLLDRIES